MCVLGNAKFAEVFNEEEGGDVEGDGEEGGG